MKIPSLRNRLIIHLLVIFLLIPLLSACAAATPAAAPTPASTPTLPPSSILCILQTNPREIATLVDVVDGDTIKVDLDGETYKVRYIGMDTPERGRPFYEEATAKNAELLDGQTVLLVKDVSETDKYDRLLRYVFVGDTFVNFELVNQGYAEAATFPPDVSCDSVFRAAETDARSHERGLWAP
jgi:endonuclease YncB( thermonuclease family)